MKSTEIMEKTQLEIANEQLMALAPELAVSDKQEAVIRFSWPTLTRYLRGEGKNLDTAITLLTMFKKRIQERNELLKADVKVTPDLTKVNTR